MIKKWREHHAFEVVYNISYIKQEKNCKKKPKQKY